MIQITLQYATLAEAAAALGWLERQSDIQAVAVRGIGIDAPDVGRSVEPSAAAVFGGAAVPLPPAMPAPSSAVAVPQPTAPVAPPASSPVPTPVAAPAAPTPVPAAPAPTAAAAPTTHAGRDVDADGLWWDERIHSGGKAKNDDGRWRKRRGLNDSALVQRIEAEIRAAMGAPAATVAAPVVPVPPAPPVAPTVPVPPASGGIADFGTLMMKIQPLLLSGALPQETLNGALRTAGLNAIGELMLRNDLVPQVHAALLGAGIAVA